MADQEAWSMYNMRALIDFDGKDDKVTESDEFLNTIEERLGDNNPGEDPSKSEIKAARKSLIDRYQGVGYLPTDEFDDGKWWVETWNEQQNAKAESDRLTLVYGHDSNRGLQIKDYSFGLDTGCVGGDKLTALVLQPKAGADGKVTLEQQLVDVSCPDDN